jgi:histidinol-phosphate aminotransferase
MFELSKLLRQNIKNLKPYSSARDEYSGKEAIFLDANENPFNQPYNRYPDPLQSDLKKEISRIKGVLPEQIFLGNGSDEAIDLVFRAFCQPGNDNIITIKPTYGMYRVAADINDIEVIEIGLLKDFALPVKQIIESINYKSKAIFLCSPNNPTSNLFPKNDIIEIINSFDGIVVLDEAYIDFAPGQSLLPELIKHPNLIILQTFSKAWGLAGIRLGMAFASKEIIEVFNKIKYPYNVNNLTANYALEAIKNNKNKDVWVKNIIENREIVRNMLSELPFVKKIYHSDANFLLVEVDEPKQIYDYLVANKIIVRNRSNVYLCNGCLRITIGTPAENTMLVHSLKNYKAN